MSAHCHTYTYEWQFLGSRQVCASTVTYYHYQPFDELLQLMNECQHQNPVHLASTLGLPDLRLKIRAVVSVPELV